MATITTLLYDKPIEQDEYQGIPIAPPRLATQGGKSGSDVSIREPPYNPH